MATYQTESCDSGNCEHWVPLHTAQTGVYCAECAAKRLRYLFDPEAETA